nr:DNA cytosine methyltransferase [Palleronia caenipelagi]
MRAEQFGVPQRRHRVIIVGVRSDLSGKAARAEIAVSGLTRTVRDVIGTMPDLRGGISRELRPCHRTAGYFTPVHERSTPWDSIDGNTRMSSRVRCAVRHWFKHRIERG